VADLTNKLRLMKNGMNKITLRELKLARGSYIAKLFDGRKYHVQDFIINKWQNSGDNLDIKKGYNKKVVTFFLGEKGG